MINWLKKRGDLILVIIIACVASVMLASIQRDARKSRDAKDKTKSVARRAEAARVRKLEIDNAKLKERLRWCRTPEKTGARR